MLESMPRKNVRKRNIRSHLVLVIPMVTGAAANFHFSPFNLRLTTTG